MDAPPVQYVRTSDGFDIAYAIVGEGRTLLAGPWPHSNLQLDWNQSGEHMQLVRALAGRFRLVEYDARGQGMSTRDIPVTTTCDDFVKDMEAVVDRLRLDHLILYGWGNALGHVALLYAARHPERVDALVLQCSAVHAQAWPASVFVDLPAENWTYYLRQVARARVQGSKRFADPAGPALDEDSVYETLLQSVHRLDWQRTLRAFLDSDVSDILPGMEVPTLVLHQRDFGPLPVEEAVKLTACIPNARLVLLEGSGLYGNPAQFLTAVDEFLADLSPGSAGPLSVNLSVRERDVLRLLAAGHSNRQIADELVISLNTVRRHVSNIFDKTGATNRAQAAVYARDHGLN